MQRTSDDMTTHVLVFGQTQDQWSEWKTMIKGGLQSGHMGWSFSSALAFSVEQATRWIEEHEELEIVYFSDEGQHHRSVVEEAMVIAEALSRHKHKPWVVLSPGLGDLKSIFEFTGIRVEQFMVEDVIRERFRSQLVEKSLA